MSTDKDDSEQITARQFLKQNGIDQDNFYCSYEDEVAGKLHFNVLEFMEAYAAQKMANDSKNRQGEVSPLKGMVSLLRDEMKELGLNDEDAITADGLNYYQPYDIAHCLSVAAKYLERKEAN